MNIPSFAGSGLLVLLLAAVLIAVPAPGQADPPKLRWGERIEVASGGAFRGPWRMNESEFHYVDDPTVAISEKGHVGVAWADQARKDIFFQIYEPGGKLRFKEPVNVSRSPRIFSWLPRMVIASTDASVVQILWQEIVFAGGSHGGEIFFARSTDGGRTFGDPVNLSNTTGGAGKGRLTRDIWHNGSLDGKGNLYVIWELFPGRTHYPRGLGFTFSSNGGRTFAPPSVVSGSADPALGVNGSQQGLLMRQLAVNAAGAMAIVNSTFRMNERSHVWLLRGEAAGR